MEELLKKSVAEISDEICEIQKEPLEILQKEFLKKMKMSIVKFLK